MAWSCRSHSPPWSQIGQSSGWLMSRNSITPSRAFLTILVLVKTSGGSPLGPGRQSRTPQAQLATGLGEPLSSTRHMRQLPAIESRSWKQNRGISAPAASHACKSVYSGGTSISLPSTMSLLMSHLRFETSVQRQPCEQDRRHGDAEGHVQPRQQPDDASQRLHGRHHALLYSAATRTGSGCGFAAY